MKRNWRTNFQNYKKKKSKTKELNKAKINQIIEEKWSKTCHWSAVDHLVRRRLRGPINGLGRLGVRRLRLRGNGSHDGISPNSGEKPLAPGAAVPAGGGGKRRGPVETICSAVDELCGRVHGGNLSRLKNQ